MVVGVHLVTENGHSKGSAFGFREKQNIYTMPRGHGIPRDIWYLDREEYNHVNKTAMCQRSETFVTGESRKSKVRSCHPEAISTTSSIIRNGLPSFQTRSK